MSSSVPFGMESYLDHIGSSKGYGSAKIVISAFRHGVLFGQLPESAAEAINQLSSVPFGMESYLDTEGVWRMGSHLQKSSVPFGMESYLDP